MRLAIFLIAAFSTVSCAEDKPKAPVIPAELEAKFWRAQTHFLAILPDYQAREKEVNAARAAVNEICGDKYQLADTNGLKCVPKPKPTKEKK